MPRERREEARQALQVRVRMRPTDARPVAPSEALIEDRSLRGLRLSSRSPLLPDAVVVLTPLGELQPLHARVVWTRRGKDAWNAGCRLLAESAPQARLRGESALVREPGASAARALVVAGLIGLAVFAVYAFLRFTTMIAEEAVFGP